jgi:hypothetical protein
MENHGNMLLSFIIVASERSLKKEILRKLSGVAVCANNRLLTSSEPGKQALRFLGGRCSSVIRQDSAQDHDVVNRMPSIPES